VVGDVYPSPSPPGSYRRRFLAFGGKAASSRLRVVLDCRISMSWGGSVVKESLDRFQNSQYRFQVSYSERRLHFFLRCVLGLVFGGLLGWVGAGGG
jgi:hypothetical protein